MEVSIWWNNKVRDIVVSDGEGYILSGISYWSKDDAITIVKELEKCIENGDFEDLYWDDIVKDNLNKLEVFINNIGDKDSFEIDSLEDLDKLNIILNRM